jgi:hypothetical protein
MSCFVVSLDWMRLARIPLTRLSSCRTVELDGHEQVGAILEDKKVMHLFRARGTFWRVMMMYREGPHESGISFSLVTQAHALSKHDNVDGQCFVHSCISTTRYDAVIGGHTQKPETTRIHHETEKWMHVSLY